MIRGARRVLASGVLVASALLAGCSTTTSNTIDTATTPAITPGPATSTTTTPTTSTSTSASTSTSTSVAATPPPTTVADAGVFLGEEVIGTSVGGRPIVATHRGTPGGMVVLVVGVIHGDENDGLAVLGLLGAMPMPSGIDLWLMPAMNPDGLANDERGNGNGVDLNRNFPHDWTQIGEPGNGQYSGTGPASEPETKAFIAFAERIKPTLTIWYHQDLHRISPSTGRDAPLRQRYAELTGLELLSITGGTYTGVAATWVRQTVPEAMSFIVELGSSLSAEEAATHADAVLVVAQLAATV